MKILHSPFNDSNVQHCNSRSIIEQNSYETTLYIMLSAALFHVAIYFYWSPSSALENKEVFQNDNHKFITKHVRQFYHLNLNK